MLIYYLLILFWINMYILIKPNSYNKKSRFKFVFIAGIALFLVMGLRHYSVGSDTERYIELYNYSKTEFSKDIFKHDEWGYQLLLIIFMKIGLNDQGYLLAIAAIIVSSFMLFYYEYSKNIFLSIFLHITIGLFTMSMSGVRQTIAICLILLAFHLIIKKRFLWFVLVVFIAQTFHNSAIIFFPVYFLKNIDVNRKKGSLFLLITSSIIVFRTALVPIMEIFMPERYTMRYELITDAFRINPLLIVIAFAIPVACLLFWKKIEFEGDKERNLFSFLFILACINLLFNILSLNSNMIGRLSFYFVPFITVLIPNVIVTIKNKKIRTLAIYFCLVLPLVQFTMSTPGGIYNIDKYKFFWQ